MISKLSSSLNKAHASYGKSVGKHFPLWVCAYTALAATATFFILFGTKRLHAFQTIQPRLGSAGCITSFVAGSLLGGATLGLVSLPAWGKGHQGFTRKFTETVNSKSNVPLKCAHTFTFYSLKRVHPLVSSLLKSEKIHISFMGRLASAVEAIAFTILALLDLTVGLASLPFTALTLGKHKGCREVTVGSLSSTGSGVILAISCGKKAVLPRGKSNNN